MDLPALALAYRAALLQGGSTVQHARKQAYTVLRAGEAPGAFLEANRHRWTATTAADTSNRLRMFGNWLAGANPTEPANPWLSLPRVVGEKAPPGRAVFTREEVQRLVSCERIPAHRRAAYYAMACLGLRPVEVSRIKAEFIIREGQGFHLRLPAACQKSGRADAISLTASEAALILENLPLMREPVQHFGGTFHLDLGRARIQSKQGDALRRAYNLRSFYVSELLRSGADVESVRKLARHRNVLTTLGHYSKHLDSQVAEVRSKVFRSLAPKSRKAVAV